MQYGLIGAHLSHSYSKLIHERLTDYQYDLLELDAQALDRFMREKSFRAINVTIPYKQTVIPYLDELSPAAAQIGAVNTIVNRGGRLCGYNTDCDGLRALLRRNGVSLSGKKVLILGSGGTSRTARAVALQEGAACALRLSRGEAEGCLSYARACREHADAEVILNTTPAGMYPALDGQAIDLAGFPRLEAVADVIYNPLRSQLLMQAKQRGIPCCGGLYMLVAQAVYAIGLFLGARPGDEQTEQVYRALRQSRENIVLIGMPGSGKSTVGALLAAGTGRELVEMDALLAARAGKSIPEIFARDGEAAFRALEHALAFELAGRTGCVLSTGGGVILDAENVMRLKQNGRLFFLDRPLAELLPTEDRPLSSDRAALARRYAERYALYQAAADHVIAASGPPQCVADQIRRVFDL